MCTDNNKGNHYYERIDRANMLQQNIQENLCNILKKVKIKQITNLPDLADKKTHNKHHLS